MTHAEISEKYACNICRKETLRYFLTANDYITGEHFELWSCPECRTMQTMPLLSDEGLQKYYQKAYYGRRKSFTDNIINDGRIRAVKKLKSVKKPETILDIGCGNGLFLAGMKKDGWKISGTELAPESHTHPEVLPFVCRKPIAECGFADETFGIITMWHTLEHFIDPVAYLRQANRLLKKDGILIIEVPNYESWQFFLTRKNWFPLELPRHRTHFSPDALKIILERNGFRVIKEAYGNFFYDVFGFTQSVLNILCGQKNILFNILNGKIPASTNGAQNMIDIFITITLTPPLSVIGVLFYFTEILTKHSGTIRIFAQKSQ